MCTWSKKLVKAAKNATKRIANGDCVICLLVNEKSNDKDAIICGDIPSLSAILAVVIKNDKTFRHIVEAALQCAKDVEQEEAEQATEQATEETKEETKEE